ncbi:MAG: N-acetylmuramoyl-L-alanine amidase [Bacteroidia bacterium]|nr:N-acetylmuramoyl-L-alanine amidase [Bacteroidia bacterium]
MLEAIRRFFAGIFGFESPVQSTSGGPEDGSDIREETIIHIEKNPATEHRSRGVGLEITEVIETDGDGSHSESPLFEISHPRFLWCLDNGHGKLQEGKRSPLFEDGSRFEEWEFNRDIVRRIMEKLDVCGVQYYNVVPEVEIDAFTTGRAQRANEKVSPLGLPKIFLSVHANAFGMSTWADGITGIEVWHYPGSNAGMRLASVFQRELMKKLPDWVDRGIKSHKPNSSQIFTVLRVPQMPTVLTENGFYTDRNQARSLMTAETRQKIADAHVAAILQVEKDGYDAIPIYRPNMVIG